MKIVILGGGLGGLSVAHNLAKRGFDDITIYERNSNTGGMARSKRVHINKNEYVNGTIRENGKYMHDGKNIRHVNGTVRHVNGNNKQIRKKELPFNYSWRILGKEYRNFREILRDIPIEDGNVEDLFIDISKHWFIIDKKIIEMDVSISTIIKFYGRLKTLCLMDMINISRAYLYSLITCDERIDTHDDQTWRSFVGPLSKDAHMMFIESCGPVFGIDSHNNNATSILNVISGVSFFVPNHNQILNTTWDEGIFKPWEAHLKDLGVKIRLNTTIDAIEIKSDRIANIIVDDKVERYRENITADVYFICLPVESAEKLLRTSKMGNSLLHLKNNSKQLMTNLTVYFEERIYMSNVERYEINDNIEEIYMKGDDASGSSKSTPNSSATAKLCHETRNKLCIYLPESPWKVIIHPCGELWKDNIEDKYGVGDIWFVGICCQHCKGTLHGKKFSECSIKESTEEVLHQMYSHGLDENLSTRSGKKFSDVVILGTRMWESFHDDSESHIYTSEPKFSNNVDTLKYAPLPECPDIENAYFATAYCKMSRKIFLMEGAFESSGVACNAFLDSINSDVERVNVIKTKPRFMALEGLRVIDRALFNKGLPHMSKYIHPLFIITIYFMIIGILIIKIGYL